LRQEDEHQQHTDDWFADRRDAIRLEHTSADLDSLGQG